MGIHANEHMANYPLEIHLLRSSSGGDYGSGDYTMHTIRTIRLGLLGGALHRTCELSTLVKDLVTNNFPFSDFTEEGIMATGSG